MFGVKPRLTKLTGKASGVALATAMLLLAGCDSVDDISSFFSIDEPPLPGQRIAILDVAGGIEADPRLRETEIVLPAPYTNDGWTQSGGSPTHAMYHLEAGINGLNLAWRRDAGAGSSGIQTVLATPVVADNKVFLLDTNTRVHAIDLASGEKIWSRSAVPPGEDEDEGLGGGVGLYGDVLYVTTGYGWVVAIDSVSGKRYWAKNMKVPLRAAPTISNRRIIVVGVDNSVRSLDARTGETIWTWNGIAADSAVIGAGSPAVSRNIVVVPLSSGDLVALRLDNGAQIWSESMLNRSTSSSLKDIADVNGHPVIDRDLVFAVGHAGRMVAIELETGTPRWSTEIGGRGTIWPAGDWLFALTNDNVVTAIERETGRLAWVRQLPRYERPDRRADFIHWAGPVLVGDRLLVASSTEMILSLSPYDGAIIGKLDLPDPVTVDPVISNDTVLLLTDGGDLMAFR